MREDTRYLVDYLPQLEASFSYACLGLVTGLLSQERQKQFGRALIATGNKLLEHSAQPIEATEYNTRQCAECDSPRCWSETPFGQHERNLEQIVEIYDLYKAYHREGGNG